MALILTSSLAVMAFFVPIPWWAFALLVLAWLIITAMGSFFVGWDYHLKSLHHNPDTGENWVSLTFDDGPNPEFTPRVLKLLKKHGATATFFCIGKQIERHPEILKQILEEGHSIGNHTYSHSRTFGFFTSKKVKSELLATKSVVEQLTGLKMNLYRPAFGVTNPQIEKAIKSLGLLSVGWSVRSLDTTPRSEDRIYLRITRRVAKGDIILLHDTSEKTLAVLERLLVFLRKKNLESVPANRLLEIEAYEQLES
ncbi:polysaccharide deacetylase family protein [Pricia sp. S334]|uniref:Polysaccharide deacetylase family protein n=1 Tax=Pricia mediterranea TaxID=3076079 RepID=A0ABU3L4P3_9FLAO|nr:polysaccharide deacetylase family protein [Pricia sp. S334]MDT7828600.1 polysaccharide deacetylase family protein [Pricia sp. S334]